MFNLLLIVASLLVPPHFDSTTLVWSSRNGPLEFADQGSCFAVQNDADFKAAVEEFRTAADAQVGAGTYSIDIRCVSENEDEIKRVVAPGTKFPDRKPDGPLDTRDPLEGVADVLAEMNRQGGMMRVYCNLKPEDPICRFLPPRTR
jgi:hypothetical protein